MLGLSNPYVSRACALQVVQSPTETGAWVVAALTPGLWACSKKWFGQKLAPLGRHPQLGFGWAQWGGRLSDGAPTAGLPQPSLFQLLFLVVGKLGFEVCAFEVNALYIWLLYKKSTLLLLFFKWKSLLSLNSKLWESNVLWACQLDQNCLENMGIGSSHLRIPDGLGWAYKLV